jgi:hypothetical protein
MFHSETRVASRLAIAISEIGAGGFDGEAGLLPTIQRFEPNPQGFVFRRGEREEGV